MSFLPVDTIIQGGCVGITLMLLFFGYRLGTQALTIASNHLLHIADALGQMNAKMDVLIGVAVDTAKTAHDDSEKSVGPRGRKGARGRSGKDA